MLIDQSNKSSMSVWLFSGHFRVSFFPGYVFRVVQFSGNCVQDPKISGEIPSSTHVATILPGLYADDSLIIGLPSAASASCPLLEQQLSQQALTMFRC